MTEMQNRQDLTFGIAPGVPEINRSTTAHLRAQNQADSLFLVRKLKDKLAKYVGEMQIIVRVHRENNDISDTKDMEAQAAAAACASIQMQPTLLRTSPLCDGVSALC